MRHTLFIIIVILLLPVSSRGQKAEFDISEKLWDAQWIKHPASNGQSYEVLHYRRNFELDSVPGELKLDISGDSRYRFLVNGNPVCFGPASSDLMHWNYETVDIAPYLEQGRNVLAVLVWNYGKYRPFIHLSHHTGMILRVSGPDLLHLNSGKPGWKVVRNQAFSPNNPTGVPHSIYGAIGTSDRINGALFPFGWETIAYDDSQWIEATPFAPGKDPGFIYGGDRFLEARDIPMLEEKREEITVIRRISGLAEKMEKLQFPLVIPAGNEVSLLLDKEYLTVGYPELILGKGRGASVSITYAESLYKDHRSHEKGNRDSIEGKYIRGYTDLFEPDGRDSALYRPLWNRTFRYLRMDITTGNDPLVIQDYYNVFTAYPFEQQASFSSNDPALETIWDVSWHTARLCAMESYMDCPYWEQLQYIGDTRIQALVSLYVSGDDRLVRRALNQFSNSAGPGGLTLSRYPTAQPQVIPTFSLLWIGMVHDYFMHRDDDEFIRNLLPKMSSVLAYFESKQDGADPLHIEPGWWCFVDWADEHSTGIPHGFNRGNSSIIAMQYVDALQNAAEIFQHFGKSEQAATYFREAEKLKGRLYKQCFNEERGLLAQTPEQRVFSQHANILGVLTNTIPEKKHQEIMRLVVTDPTLVQTTIYFRFYLFRALKKAGLGDLYLEQLAPWYEAIENGLTTFPEEPEPSRSDCHAWSASPNYDFLSTVCGIEPGSPGFETVSVEPSMGELEYVKGEMPHPLGTIIVDLAKKRKELRGVVTLPPDLKGEFRWKGASVILSEGENKISIKNE